MLPLKFPPLSNHRSMCWHGIILSDLRIYKILNMHETADSDIVTIIMIILRVILGVLRGATVWSIWLATLQTCIARPADMIESCTIAYLKEFCIAFMLYLILILTYDANSVIFTFKMKPLMPQIYQENFPFKKSVEIWIMKRSTFRLPTRIRWNFIGEFFWPQKKQF